MRCVRAAETRQNRKKPLQQIVQPARFQLRRYVPPGTKRPKEKPLELTVEPRSVYLIAGHARWQWEHHIPEAKDLRYSITLRTLR